MIFLLKKTEEKKIVCYILHNPGGQIILFAFSKKHYIKIICLSPKKAFRIVQKRYISTLLLREKNLRYSL